MLLALVALAAGCNVDEKDGGTGGDSSTPSATAQLTATATVPTETPTPPSDIRGEDLASRPEVQEFLGREGGEVDATQIVYADLTGDGSEEAILPVSSGGTLGNIAVFVFGYRPEGLKELLREVPPQEARGGHIRARVESGRLVVSWPVYGYNDANCCPSGGSRVRTYGWDGSRLVVEDEVITP